MDTTAKRWLTRTAKQEHWRVRGVADLAELIQDGFLIYHHITLSYPDKAVRHTMALFQTAFRRHLIDLSRKRECSPSSYLDDIDLTLIPQDEPAPTSDTAPACVRELIEACAKRPMRIYVRRRCFPDGTREPEHEWLSRMFGYAVPEDAHLQLRSFINR